MGRSINIAYCLKSNFIFHELLEHIKVDRHYVCDAIQDGSIAMYHIFTDEQLDDIFTKTLGKQRDLFIFFKSL